KVQCPLESTVVVPSMVVPSFSVTTALASPEPVSVGVEVTLSDDDEPVSLARLSVTGGALVSSTKVKNAVPALPAVSVSDTRIVWLPSSSPTGANVQSPLASAVVVPSTVVPSINVTSAFGSPEPVSVGVEVILSVDDKPVSFATRDVGRGATVSITALK